MYYLHTRQFAFPQMVEELTLWYKRKQVPIYDENLWKEKKELLEVVQKLIVFDQIKRIDMNTLCSMDYIKYILEHSTIDT